MSQTKALFTVNGLGDLIPATADEIIARRGAALTSPKAVRDFLAVKLGAREFESFCGMFLDNRHRLIEFVELFRGTIDSAAVYPREVCEGGAQAQRRRCAMRAPTSERRRGGVHR